MEFDAMRLMVTESRDASKQWQHDCPFLQPAFESVQG
jgi:hypothetical protein